MGGEYGCAGDTPRLPAGAVQGHGRIFQHVLCYHRAYEPKRKGLQVPHP